MVTKGGYAMESFGKVLKHVRKSQKATLRELGEAIGMSIGYISDIEHDRKRPPDLDTVSKIEDFLDIKDNRLLSLARKIRSAVDPTFGQRLRMNPRLSTVLLRADELPEAKKDKAIDKLIETLKQFEEEP